MCLFKDTITIITGQATQKLFSVAIYSITPRDGSLAGGNNMIIYGRGKAI